MAHKFYDKVEFRKIVSVLEPKITQEDENE